MVSLRKALPKYITLLIYIPVIISSFLLSRLVVIVRLLIKSFCMLIAFGSFWLNFFIDVLLKYPYLFSLRIGNLDH